ncbi:uncharacterized protein LOC134212214 isoform X3 [Armigeres subalbatus]|uniref:uncharacterized protein LOC134212214 isoform X3 n=1 Tax=Armigeres subalbatus TaxID=124917 RepID=UPI002ED3BBE9
MHLWTIKTSPGKPPFRSPSASSHGPPWRKIAAAMSTLTSNANNNNNNLIVSNASSPQLSRISTSSSPNTINNNNPAGTPATTASTTTTSTTHHQYQSALASGVSRLFARSMSSASASGAGADAAGTSAATTGAPASAIPAELNVMLHGYYRKLKTNKKKYFVVYGDTPDKNARLEYFDSEKKFKQSWLKSSSVQAKRSIVLRSCFNINKRHDIKKHVIALYTKDDCFCIVFDSEEELNRWLRTLLSLQRGEESEGEPPRPTFEHVWDVFVERKGLGDSCGILGTYRLCITDKTLSLVRIGPPTTNSGDERVEVVEFSLASIRRCGASQRYFYLEVGRSSKIGPGEIWMEAPDAIIAHNMHTTIMKPTKNREVDGLGPIPRNRSSSANAASKPTQMLGRRQTYTGQKPVNCSPSGGAAIARERCDSLPSRNRTTSETSTHQQQLIMNSGGMPPPRTIPSASFNRPQSMIVNRQSHSHSPPVHSSPLSPPSGACSTGSDGSSFSIDEPDSYNSSHTPDEGNGFPKVINHLSSGCSIPEENSEEYINNYGKVPLRPQMQHRSMDEFVSHLKHSYNSLSLPISQAIRRGSPAPPANIVGSVDGTSNYMEMCSPCGSSPGDPSGNSGYIPMSPSTDFPRGLYSSSAHSRTSSLAEDTVDAYVPMAAPGHNTEEYVDMDPSHNSSNRTIAPSSGFAATISHAATIGGGGGGGGGNGNISSAASSCSITSGTPSTDMRFSGYHLDKVEARFTPSEDDEMERPLRTYSVGSRLEHNKRKLRVDMLSSEGSSNSRVRAFSVGSRAKVPRSDVYKGSGAPITAPLLSAGSSGSLQETSSNSGSITNCVPGPSTNTRGSSSSINESRTGKKSSSAPMLAAKPHGSFDPIMDDLMEIDFSAPSFHAEPDVSSSTPQKASGTEDYMEMTAGGNQRNTGYVEMKPGHIPPVNTSVHEENDYLDMRPGGTPYELNLSTKSKSSPIKINSPKKFNGGGNNNNNYLEMSPRMMGTSSSSSSSATNRKPTVPSEDYLNISPLMMTSAGGDSGNEEKMINEEEEDEEEAVAPSSAPEVYMEMSWSQPKTSLNLECTKPASDEYINMDFTRKEVSGSSSAMESRLSSLPIAIQSGGPGRTLQGDTMEPKIGGAPSYYLPLNPSATQQRHQVSAQIGFSPKQNSLRSRCDSRDSGIVTPSGSQVTIFPFSPGSPIKSFAMGIEPSAEERKCYVDGTTGTLRISETDEDNSEESNEFLAMDQQQPSQPKDTADSSKLEDLSHNYAELSIGHQQQQQQSQQKPEKSRPSSFSSTKKANLSLILTTSTNTRTTPTITAMKSAVEYPDYVNCTPVTTPVATKPTTPMAVDDQAGDYAIMNPASLRKLSSTSQSELASTESGLPPLTKKSNQIFKPITSSQDEALLKKSSGVSPKPAFTRHYSERRAGTSGIDSSGYEMLQRTSRPNSVNSEKINNKCPPSAGSTRPSSANSDRLPIISATSSSASSTSTLCESKNQSPTASSTMIATTTTTVTPGVRPESVTSLTDPQIISRPPSVSSERELHYASLDLPPSTNPLSVAAPGSAVVVPPNRMEIDLDSCNAAAASRPGGPDSLNSSPSPNSGCTSQQQTGSAFTYAQIDFVRSVAQAQTQQQQQQSLPKSGQQQQ